MLRIAPDITDARLQRAKWPKRMALARLSASRCIARVLLVMFGKKGGGD